MKQTNVLKNLLAGLAVLSTQLAAAQTFHNETVSATWGMQDGENESIQAVVSHEDAFSSTAFKVGKELTFSRVLTYSGADEEIPMNSFRPSAKVLGSTEGHDLTFAVKPTKGLELKPTQISFKTGVFGTGGGLIDILLRYADGTEHSIASSVKPQRSGKGINATDCTYALESLPSSTEKLEVVIRVYTLDNTKEIGFNQVVLTSKVSGEVIAVPQYSISTTMEPENAGEVTQMPAETTLDENTEVTVTATPKFGFHFLHWADTAGNIVSEANPYTFTLSANTALKAVFQSVNTYSFSTRCTNDRELQIGSVSLNPEPIEGKYEEGTLVSILANELPIAKFLNWADKFENANVTTASRELTVNQDTEVIANYEIQDFIAAFNSDKAEIWANKGTYPFVADYAWDEQRNATAAVVRATDGVALKGSASGTPVVRMRRGSVISSVKGLFMNGYRSTDVAMQVQFSTLGFSTVRFTADLVAKNAASVHWKALYSTDGTTFKPVICNGEEMLYSLATSVATRVDFELPAEEVAQKETIYIRLTGSGDEIFNDKYTFDKTDEESGLNYTTNSEAGLGNIYIFGTPVIEEDNINPEIKAITPADQENSVSANGKITVTFNERIQYGNGEATLTGNGKTITLEPEFGSSSVSFRYHNLAYSTTYTLEMPKGYVTDRSSNDAPAVSSSFTVMDRIKPEARLFNAIVDQSLKETILPSANQIGQYKTIQEAIDAVPTDNSKPWLIFIKAGYYNDLNHRNFPTGKYTWEDQSGKLPASEDSRIVVVDRPFVHLIGESVDKVIIAQDRIAGSNAADKKQPWYNVAEGATLVIKSNDFYAENLTIDNEWWTKYKGKEARGPQALALYAEADRVAFNNCRIRSYQDTYLSPKTQNNNAGNNQPHYFDRNYMRNTFIEGAVDFIYGAGDVFFDHCTLNIVRPSGGYIVAPSHNNETRWGYVFKNTVITAPDGSEDNTQVYFGRPWHNAPKTVFIDTECRVKPYEGYWYPTMGGIPAIWAVYNIWNKNGYKMSEESIEDYWYDGDNGKVEGKAKNFLTDEEATAYTMENIFKGDGTEGVTGIWNPQPLVEQTAQPVISNKEGETSFAWSTDEYAICYVVTINGTVAGFTTTNSFEANLNDVVTVQSVNEYGALSQPSKAVTIGISATSIETELAETQALEVSGGKGMMNLRGIDTKTAISIYRTDGTLVRELTLTRNASFSMPAGTYLVKAGNNTCKVLVH